MVRLSRRARVTSSLLVQRRSNQEESTPEWRENSQFLLPLGPRAVPRDIHVARNRRRLPGGDPFRALTPTAAGIGRAIRGLTFRTDVTTALISILHFRRLFRLATAAESSILVHSSSSSRT